MVWRVCALASRAPVLRIPHEPDGGLTGATSPESVMQTSDLIVNDLAVSRTSNQGDRGMVEVAIIVAAVPALAIATPPAVLLNDVGSFNDAGGIIPDCVELNVGSGVFCVAHGVDLVDGINMDEDQNTVYRENRFSVDFEENPMFAGVKQGSLFCERSELQEELGLRSDVNRACRQAPIDDCLAFGLGQPELGLGMQHLDLNGRVGSVAVGHGQAV